MPKFIGCRIEGAQKIEDNANPAGLMRLSYSQAKLLPPGEVVCSLDTTDRGGPHSLAKRWYRWFATPMAVLACPAATPRMRVKAYQRLNSAA